MAAQREGATVMWLSAGLKEWAAFGPTVGFQDYELPSISENPEVQVHAIRNPEQRGRVDEPGLPSLAPR